jgi:hypothetical protein
MSKFERSWLLFRSSLPVMMSNRMLLVFPALIATFMLCIAGLFFVPVALQPTGNDYTSGAHWKAVAGKFYEKKNVSTEGSSLTSSSSRRHGRTRLVLTSVKPLGIILFSGMYFVSMFCATFLNVAFYHEIMKALKGQPISITDGLRFACTRWQTILLWTLFAGAIGLCIKSLEQRVGWVGQLILRLLGTAWSIACVFVIPIIVTEEESASPITILKKSALTLKQTWGESLIGYAGVSLGSTLFVLASLLWLGGGIALAIFMDSIWVIAVVAVLWILVMIAFSYLMGIASQIFRCALYLYAVEGAMPSPYTSEMTELAWKTKTS